jgi:hypothetical protein
MRRDNRLAKLPIQVLPLLSVLADRAEGTGSESRHVWFWASRPEPVLVVADDWVTVSRYEYPCRGHPFTGYMKRKVT